MSEMYRRQREPITLPMNGELQDMTAAGPEEEQAGSSRVIQTPGLQADGAGRPVGSFAGAQDAAGGRRPDKPWEERLAEALQTLNEYRAGKATLEQRVIEAERYYRQQNWAGKHGDRKQYGVKTNSGWLFNSCMVKHADAMDNYPEPNVLPREQSDEQTAKLLSEVLPCVLEMCDYEEIYDRAWWDKIVKGTAVYCVSWDAEKENGLGDVDISLVDILNVFWDTACADIQESRNFFCVKLIDNDQLEDDYGDLVRDKLGSATFVPGQYAYETTHKTTGRSAVIDWYYKRNGVLHLCKFVENIVLYASEDDERYAERGYYDHKNYPFIFDPMYPVVASPFGFGQVDLCRDSQNYIDRLDSAILDSALINSRPKHFINNSGGVNEQEAADPEKPFVHVNGSGAIQDSVMPYPKSELNGVYMQVLTSKIQELRETSGSNEASQGGAPAGVTAYSALAALQESSAKGSRDIIRAGYRRFKDVCYMIIELLRQFYDAPRVFRITGDGMMGMQYQAFDNTMLQPQPQPGILGVDFAERLPVFDIKVKAAKQSAYSRMAQNELAKELYGMGMFAPQNADSALMVLDMMSFEGKEKIVEKVRQNGGMYLMMQQMAMEIQQLQAALGMQAQAEQAAGPEAGGGQGQGAEPEKRADSLGNEQQTGKRITAPRERALNANSVE